MAKLNQVARNPKHFHKISLNASRGNTMHVLHCCQHPAKTSMDIPLIAKKAFKAIIVKSEIYDTRHF
jgi:hypothetical protein